MTRIAFFAGLLIFLPLVCVAQQIEIFGYFEPQLMGARIGSELYQLSSNKLRVDLQSEISDHVTFGANFDYITYHGKTEWDILKFLPERTKNQAPWTQLFGYNFNPYVLQFNDRQFLDNAYLKLALKYADVTIGKQQLSMGTGYAWNPTDVFNKKDITDPTYEQPGHNALRVDLPLGAGYRITSIYAPTDDWEYTDFLLKLKGRISHFDFSVLGIQKQWRYTDARLFDPLLMSFYQIPTKRRILGADFAGELLGLGVWGEYAYNDIYVNATKYVIYKNAVISSQSASQPMNIPANYYELVLGVDYTFDFQTYIMVEYYRNTEAHSDHRNYSFNDWMHLLFAEKRSITRDQIYAFVQHPLTDLIDFGNSCIYSISDNSLAIIPMLTYNIFQNVDLTLIGNIYFGEEGAVYSDNMGNGGLVRARVYF
ncbi:hypothetical protein GF337_09975 [candidate division KSB1 bacterium]|nr:hypothetical protein [candidate division KSB1 bacterium]